MDISSLNNYFELYGGMAIFIVVLLEYMNLPGFPAGIIMPLAGIYAAHGGISLLAAIAISVLAGEVGSWILYFLGMYNAKFSSADEVYASIYRQAKVSIYVVDNYIGLRTLVHLKNSQSGVSIILFSDNVGNNKLHNIEFTDFCKEYPNVKISMQKTGEIFHDRFIVLDYGTADERVFLCGASSKDAGARITSIVEDYGTKKYASVMATLLQNPPLVLPK